MDKTKIEALVSKKLDEIYEEICKETGLKDLKEGYIPVSLSLKADNLVLYVTDHIDEIMEMNRIRQKPPVYDLPVENLKIIYDGIGEDGMAFYNETYPVNNLKDLRDEIDTLRKEGFFNIAVEYGDDTWYLSDMTMTLEEVEAYIKEDIDKQEDMDRE